MKFRNNQIVDACKFLKEFDGYYNFIKLLIIFFFGAVFEMTSATALGLYFGYLFSGMSDNVVLINLLEALDDFEQPIEIFTYAVFIIFFTSIILRIFVLFLGTRFSWNMQRRISQRIATNVLKMNYENFINFKQEDLRRLILNEATNVASGIIQPLLSFFSNLFVIAFLVLALLIYDPITTVVAVSILTLLISIFTFVIKNSLMRLGREKVAADSRRIETVDVTLKLFEQIQIFGKKDLFIDRFAEGASVFATNNAKQVFFRSMPRIYLDFVIICGLLFYIMATVDLVSGETQSIIAELSMFSVIAFRLLPATSLLSQSIASMSFNFKSLSQIQQFTVDTRFLRQDLANRNHKGLNATGTLIAQNLSFKYKASFENVIGVETLTFEPGGWYQIQGASGSGKTTLVRLLLGILAPDTGVVAWRCSGADDKIGFHGAKIASVTQENIVLDDSILFNLTFQENLDDVDVNWLKVCLDAACCDFVDLSDLERRIGPSGSFLSGGQVQRICIARALYTKPQILFLDEATSHLDTLTAKTVINNIKDMLFNTIVIYISHNDNHYTDVNPKVIPSHEFNKSAT